MKKLEKIAEENFKLWAEALLSGDPHQVATMYDSKATFLPTMSPQLRIGEMEAEEYFEHFLQIHPNGKIVKQSVQKIGARCYLHCGLYNFEVDDDKHKGKRKIVEARFSYSWKRKNWILDLWERVFHNRNTWKIIHHHSSLKP